MIGPVSNGRQRGVTTVEFAIIGAVMLVVLLGCIEVGRAMFVVNALTESTRRGARVAAVCPVNDPAIARTAVFNSSGGDGSPIVGGLSTANIKVAYLAENGLELSDPVGSFSLIHFVRVQVVDFQHQMLIPFGEYIFDAPASVTTLPRESLGVPREGTVQPC
jgi:hypothetical protein